MITLTRLTKNGKIRINFRNDPDNFIHARCNFKCSYCAQWRITKQYINKNHVSRIISIWNNLATIDDEILVRINFNGESLYDKFVKQIISHINKIENVKIFEILTNNSINPNKYLNSLDLTKMSFNCSYHPEFISIKKFLNHMHIIEDAGCNVFANVVATPQIIKKIPKIFRKFQKNNLRIKLQGFYYWSCCYKGRTFPMGYIQEERKAISQYFDSKEEFEYMVELKNTKGLPCYAGVDMLNIFMDGSVRRCFKGDIGNIQDLIDNKIKLKKEPYPCHRNFCGCYAHLIGLESFREKYKLCDNFVDNYEIN